MGSRRIGAPATGDHVSVCARAATRCCVNVELSRSLSNKGLPKRVPASRIPKRHTPSVRRCETAVFLSHRNAFSGILKPRDFNHLRQKKQKLARTSRPVDQQDLPLCGLASLTCIWEIWFDSAVLGGPACFSRAGLERWATDGRLRLPGRCVEDIEEAKRVPEVERQSLYDELSLTCCLTASTKNCQSLRSRTDRH